MAVAFPIEDALAAVRSLMLTAWGMEEGTDPILETGDDPIQAEDFADGRVPVPLGIIQIAGEAPLSIGMPVRSRTLTLPLNLWLVMKKQAGTRAILALREKLTALEELIYDDPHLSGIAVNTEVAAINWSGTAADAPIAWPDPSGGALAGYVSVAVDLEGQF